MPGISTLIEITNNGIRGIVGSDSDSDLVHHVVLVLPREVDGQGHVVNVAVHEGPLVPPKLELPWVWSDAEAQRQRPRPISAMNDPNIGHPTL